MYSRVLLFISLIAGLVPLVTACEGECIVGITRAFLGNYSEPIHTVLGVLGQKISTELMPPSRRPEDPMSLVGPILKAYRDVSYNELEHDIFPSYFHGKCQRFSKDGQDPPGCPNPDCPVVCGTPGSMVHFYSTLRFIVFSSTNTTLTRLVTPGSPTYKQVEKLVQSYQGTRRRDLAASHGMGIVPESHDGAARRKRFLYRLLGSVTRQTDVLRLGTRSTRTLAAILSQLGPLLAEVCGGGARDSRDGLPKCSWEVNMKEYILSYP